MNAFHFQVQLRWADMDANFHLRHDAYYAIGAQARVAWLFSVGLTPPHMLEGNFGPILFREECIFKREIQLGHNVEILLRLSKARADGSRWSMRHEYVRDDGTVCAVLTVDGAWIDTKLRKLTAPPQQYMQPFLGLARTPDFEALSSPPAEAARG